MLTAMRQQKKDGIANYVWQAKNLPALSPASWVGIATNGSRVVVVSGLGGEGYQKVSSYSDDGGDTWSTPISFLPDSSKIRITDMAFGNGIFAVVGYTETFQVVAFTSNDGVNFIQRPLSVEASNNPRIVFARGRFYFFGQLSSKSTADFITFSNVTAPGLTPGSNLYIADSGSIIVYSNNAGRASSVDGVTFSNFQLWSPSANRGTIEHINSQFIVGATSTPAIFYASYDGSSWGTRPTGLNFPNVVSSVVTPSGKGVFLSSGSVGRSAVTQDGFSFVLSSPYATGNSAGDCCYSMGRVLALSGRIGTSGDYVHVMEIS